MFLKPSFENNTYSVFDMVQFKGTVNGDTITEAKTEKLKSLTNSETSLKGVLRIPLK